MNFWKRIFVLAIGILYFSTAAVAQAQTQTFTILPETGKRANGGEVFPTERACHLFLDDFEDLFFFGDFDQEDDEGNKIEATNGYRFDAAIFEMSKKIPDYNFTRDDVLGCAVKTGRVSFAYIPFFATYALALGAMTAGVVAMLFIVVGAYRYVFSGITDGKEEAKKTIQYAIAGLVVSSFAWVIVQLVQAFVSS